MQETAQSFSSGEWLVRAGNEEEFVSRWTTFTEWSLNNAPRAEAFVLARSTEEPRKFLSLGAWESQEALDAWREMPRMQELLGLCRELCEEFAFGSYTLASNPGGARPGATRQAAQTIQEGAQTVQGGVTATGQTVGGLLGAATGAMTDVTAGTLGAAAEGTERAVEAVAFPIEGYDEMNVDEISKRLQDLSVEELQLVRDYEELNKKRESLLERMDRKIRSA
jgi:quinol monooxygenase YgiN